MNRVLHAAACIFAVSYMPWAMAATSDGTLGATSTGSTDLDLQVQDSVQISALDTIDFGTYGGANIGPRSREEPYCVYVNGGGNYTITPSSVNGAFQLFGTVFGDIIPYDLKIVGTATGAGAALSAIYNLPSLPFTGSSSLTCGGTNNASLEVSLAEQDIRDASTDLYADTLILLVSPI